MHIARTARRAEPQAAGISLRLDWFEGRDER
jgi:hypothetical protein